MTNDDPRIDRLADLLFACTGRGFDGARDGEPPNVALAPPALPAAVPPVVFNRGAWRAFARSQLRKILEAKPSSDEHTDHH